MTSSLVIQLARLGDLVQSLPLCQRLRQDGPLTLVVAFEPERRLRRVADHVVVLDPRRLADLTQDAGAFHHALWEAWGEAPGWDPPVDRVLCLNEDTAATALARLLPAANQAGAGCPGDPYHQWLGVLGGRRSENELHLTDAMLSLHPGPAAPPPVAGEPGAGAVVLHAGSGSRTRQLGGDFWSALAARLLAATTRQVLLTGSAAERRAAEALVKAVGPAPRLTNLCGETDLDQLQDVLDEAALVIAQDTGVLHLAAHLRRPLVGLYHGSAWAKETGPWLAGAQVLQIQEECAPCLEGWPPCGSYRCRTNLNGGETAELALALLAGAEPTLEKKGGRLHLTVRRLGASLSLAEAGQPAREEDLTRWRRQLTLLRDWDGQDAAVAGRPPGRCSRLEHARQAGMELADWRRREWPRPPANLCEELSWRREAARWTAERGPQDLSCPG